LIKQQDSMNASESHCHRLGDLAAQAGDERQPDHRQWAEIELALAGGPGPLRRRWLVLVIPALAGLVLWIAAGRTLGHGPQGCALARDGNLSVADERGCTVASDDGTRITLGKGTHGQLRALGPSGAELVLRSGHADLAVIHRPGVRWAVLAGPFEVRVTGTRFEVDWAPEQARFRLEVSEGEVSVTGGPLRDPTPVRAGNRFEQVATTTGHALPGDRGAGLQATAALAQAVSAEAPGKTGAELAPATAARVEHRRGALSSKPVVRGPSLVAKEEPAVAEPPVAVVEPLGRDWTASSAEDDEPALGPGRLTIGADGKLAEGAAGPVLAIGGEGTRFSLPAESLPDNLYLDRGMLCTRGKIAELACAEEKIPAMRCNWATNWGVLIQWHPRSDGQAWGSRAASSVAMEYRGKAGHYRLVAHREGDPAKQVYCIENYRSGRAVVPSEFKFACWAPGGAGLPDFTKIDSFSLQVASQETSLRFRFCLSAVSLF
jgi:ferric-dicitrate binding protein FerR (iron transport regulator)